MISFENAQEAILTAEKIASNSESNDAELSLLHSFLDSAIALIPEDKLAELAESFSDDLSEVFKDPCEEQVESIALFKKLIG